MTCCRYHNNASCQEGRSCPNKELSKVSKAVLFAFVVALSIAAFAAVTFGS